MPNKETFMKGSKSGKLQIIDDKIISTKLIKTCK